MLTDRAFVFLFDHDNWSIVAREVDHGIEGDYLTREVGWVILVFFISIGDVVSEADAMSAQGPVLSVGVSLNNCSAFIALDPFEINDLAQVIHVQDICHCALHDRCFEPLDFV